MAHNIEVNSKLFGDEVPWEEQKSWLCTMGLWDDMLKEGQMRKRFSRFYKVKFDMVPSA